jgi:hypothetical protein
MSVYKVTDFVDRHYLREFEVKNGQMVKGNTR